MYALVEFSGKQFKIEPGREIKVPHLKGDVGDQVVMEKVLFLDDGNAKLVGKPFIENASVDANIVKHGRDKKIIVFKFKRRKGYQKKQGHRQEFTILKIDKVNTGK